MKSTLARAANEVWCVPTVRASLSHNLKARDRKILSLLIKIRFLSFAFLTTPVVSLIPFALTGQKELGLASFGIGTVSIVVWLSVFKKLRSTGNPISLVKKGAIATILVNALLGCLMFYGSVRDLEPISLIHWYFFLQLFSGIPFALINGVDSKLSGSLFRAMEVEKQSAFSPNAEFRRCRAAGSTAASALGALIWSVVILFHPDAKTSAGYYSIIFALGIVPALFLLFYLRQLETRIKTHPVLKNAPARLPVSSPAKIKGHRKEINGSIVAIGCLEGLLQFSQFYFSLGAIRLLFDKVPQHQVLVILIPVVFYLVNGIEQVGALIFSRYQAHSLTIDPSNRIRLLRVRQYASLATLLFAAIFFVAHSAIGYRLHWWVWLDVVAYGFFNIVKGFAGGLSEQWNEAIGGYYPQHDEAGFTTKSALFGRFYQIASIGCFFTLNMRMNRGNFTDISTISNETKALIATLTVFLFFLLGANMVAYSWLDRRAQKPDSTWRVLLRAVVNPEDRTALFTQFLRVLFVTSLILSNLLSLKVLRFGSLTFTHGSMLYITLFVLINLISVFESAEAAIKTVFLGMISYAFVYVALRGSAWLWGDLTVGTNVITKESYDYLLAHQIGWLFFASFVAYFVTIPLDVGLVRTLSKHFTKLSPLGIAAAVTFVCQLVDTFIFIRLGFFTGRGPQRTDQLNLDMTSMIFGQFSVKFSMYLVMYFPLYLIIRFCSRWLGVKRPEAII